MKLLHINSYYNGSSFYKNLYDRQKEKGLEINVFVPVSTDIDFSTLKFGEYTKVSNNHDKYDRLAFHYKHQKIYKDIVNKYSLEKFSLVHAHSLFSNGYIALRLKKDFGIPYIVAVRNTDVNIFFKYMIHLRKLGIEILQSANRIIFLSKSYKDFVEEKYVPDKLKVEISDKSIIIPNGIDDIWFQNKVSDKVNSPEGILKLMYIGVINKNKNLMTTIKSIEILKKRGYDVCFTIVGKIVDKGIYEQIKNIPYINYYEEKSKEELIYLYRANNIFVMPSITETFGLVYAEAMSQGLPVIYTKSQGFDTQFENGKVGFSVNCKDAHDIADKIVKIHKDYENISNNCIRLVDKFKWDNITNEYSKLYKNIE